MVMLEMKPLIWSRISLFGEELAGSGIMCEIAASGRSSLLGQLAALCNSFDKPASSAGDNPHGKRLKSLEGLSTYKVLRRR
jgi:hypothetical protein